MDHGNDFLRLYEEILLLALHDEKGTVHFGALFDQAAGGAILAELLLLGKLGVTGEKGKARVVVRDPAPCGDPLLDECLDRVAGDTKARKPVEWVQKFTGVKRLKHRTARRLVTRGVLKEGRGRIFLLFNRTLYPEADSGPERELKRRIKRAVVGSTTEIDPRTVLLIALAKHTDLLKHAVDKRVLKDHEGRVKKLVAGEVAGEATREAMEALRAAIMVAVFVPVITSTAT